MCINGSLDNLDLSLTWTYQDSDKGFSPPSVNGRDYEIWEWPYYKRQGLTFSGEWRPADFTFKTSAYFQKFDNRLPDYVNWPGYEAGIPSPPSASWPLPASTSSSPNYSGESTTRCTRTTPRIPAPPPPPPEPS